MKLLNLGERCWRYQLSNNVVVVGDDETVSWIKV